MSELKNYWNNLNPSQKDTADFEASLCDMISRIEKARTRKRILFYSLGALPLLATICLFLFQSPTPSSQTLQCYAPYGQRKTLTLSDGSTVTLNSGSTLVYSDNYKKGNREVVLIGEAKFEVTKNPHQPFIVKANGFDVQVLGTVFNVNAYPENPEPSVTLESGVVKILHNDEEYLLAPDQMACLGQDALFHISNVEAEKEMLWTTGGFAFRQASITDICSYMERTYGINVQCNTLLPKYKDTSITARRDAQLTLEEFLSLCCDLIPGMKYHRENNIITIN